MAGGGGRLDSSRTPEMFQPWIMGLIHLDKKRSRLLLPQALGVQFGYDSTEEADRSKLMLT
jgi:hypothetical protein